MRKPVVLSLGLTALLTASPSSGQVRDPEMQQYRFVSDIESASALWVNPGVAGFHRRIRVIGHFTWDRPPGRDWTTGQYMAGLQSGSVGLGYRHDELNSPGRFSQGDAYTVSVGVKYRRTGIGVSRTWRTGGPSEGGWDIGVAQQLSPQVTTGLVWRDIGSPEIRDTVRDARLVGAVTLRPANRPLSFSLQGDYRTGAGDFRAFRAGATFELVSAVAATALAEWDGDGDFVGFAVVLGLRHRSGAAVAALGLDSGGDARTASLGFEANAGRLP